MARKANNITFDIDFNTNAKSVFDEIGKVSSKSGKAMEKALSDALNHAQQNLQNYADMQKKVLAGATDISKPVYENARKVAKASAEFVRVYANAQSEANHMTDVLTKPYQALEDEIKKVIALNKEYGDQKKEAQKNIELLQAVQAYEQNKQKIEECLALEKQYESSIESVNKKLETRKQHIRENNEAYNAVVARGENPEEQQLRQIDMLSDRAYKSFSTNIENLYSKINEMSPYLQIAHEYERAMTLLNVNGIQPTVQSLEEETAKLNENSIAIKENEARIAELRKQQEEMASNPDVGKFEYRGISPDAKNNILDAASAMKQLEVYAMQVGNMSNSLDKMQQSTNRMSGNTRTLVSHFHDLGNAIRKVLSHHTHLRRSNNGFFEDTKQGIRHALRNIMRYGLGIRSLYFLFRRLRNAVKEAFKAMASQVSEVNEQISKMVASFNSVKGSLATMFQPLLKVIMPAFVSAMERLQALMERIAIFFATITGQGYIYRATAQTTDWANGLGKVKKLLLGIDELNVIDKDEGGSSSWADTLSYDKIPVAANEFAQKLKEAWASEDFTGLGQIIGDKLNNTLLGVLDKLPAIQTLGRTIATRIAETINGFMSTPGLATNIGATIAGVLNVAVQTVGGFINTFNWTDLGRFILDAINGMLKNYDWVGAAWNVAQLLNGITSTIYTVVSDSKTWALFGYKLGVGIDTFAKTYHWGDLGKTVFSLITGFFNFLASAINAIDFQAIGQAVADIFKDVDWSALVWSFGNLWETISHKLVEGLAALDITGLLSGKVAHVKEIAADMAAYDYGEDSIEAKNAEKTAKYWRDKSDNTLSFWQKLGNSISTMWNDTLDAMWQMSNPMLPDDNTKYETSGKDAGEGYLKGLSSTDIPGETGKIMDSAIDAVKKTNDSHSPSKVYRKLGQDVVDGFMLPFKTGFIGQFTSVWQSLVSTVKGPINTMITYLNKFIEAVQTMQNSVADAFNTFNFDVPNALGGGNVAMNVTRWTAPKIPYLAQGAVIPPNNQFLAMLGDQKQGTNIEAPLSTIQEAVANVLEPYLRQIADNTQVLTEKDYGTYIGDREIAMASSRGSRQLGLGLIK